MIDSIQGESDAPVWARENAFPEAPAGWGWVDAKGKSHPCESIDSLTTAIRNDPDAQVMLVWTPDHKRMLVPEELIEMDDALRTARARWTQSDLETATRKLRGLGLLVIGLGALTFFKSFGSPAVEHLSLADRMLSAALAMMESTKCGLALLAFVIFAFIPWYQARKQHRELPSWTTEAIAKAVPAMRFEIWLERQKAPLTRVLVGLISMVGLAQIMCHYPSEGLGSLLSVFHNWDGTAAAGLIKDHYRHGEWWRLFTAPFLHGNIVHFLMNASALLYLGKRVEVFARWPHLPMVFLFAACVGGEASVRLVAAPTVGASGGLMGLLGFLLVFETLHARLVPRNARRRLAGGVILTALIGLVGFRYIDNAAHIGGLLAGIIYAVIVFPKSSSPARPRTNLTDRIAGSLAMMILIAVAALSIWMILHEGMMPSNQSLQTF